MLDGLEISEAHLLLSSQPLATKLPRTASAWALLMFVFGFIALTSRRAARDETENDSSGACIMRSTYSE